MLYGNGSQRSLLKNCNDGKKGRLADPMMSQPYGMYLVAKAQIVVPSQRSYVCTSPEHCVPESKPIPLNLLELKHMRFVNHNVNYIYALYTEDCQWAMAQILSKRRPILEVIVATLIQNVCMPNSCGGRPCAAMHVHLMMEN